jgi:hypothetical protein
VFEPAAILAPAFAALIAVARPVSILWGVVVPGLVFTVSFVITWALYRKFAGRPR